MSKQIAGSTYNYFLCFRVRFAETDQQGHVFFGNYLTFFDEALTGFMRAIGCSYNDLVAAGADTVYIHSECDYRARAFFEDVLDVHVRVERIGNASVTCGFAAVKEETDELIATGKLVFVTVDPQTKKPVPVPDLFRAAVRNFEGGAG